MTRRLVIVATAFLCAATAAPSAGAVARTKRQAERDVIKAVPRYAQRKAIAPLIDSNTGLLKDNVFVACKGRGKHYRGGRRASFVCSIRPTPRQRVVARLAYRGVRNGYKIHWLRLRHA